ncbi:MAG TPA: glycosyltransferase [Paucimonas sp.]|nr:glycosyltransferase [Paucimonas sp.]
MKPVRLPASATNALPRWGLFALCLLYILPGLVGRDPWKEDAAGFGIMWTMAHGGMDDWLWPHIVGLPMPEQGPLTFWLGALCIKLFGWLFGDFMAARFATIGFFLLGSLSVWYATYLLGRRPEAQPLKLAFGGQPEPRDYGRTLADGALLIYLGCLGLLPHSHMTMPGALQISLVAYSFYCAVRLFESGSVRTALMLGFGLGALVLTRGWVVPLALLAGLAVLAARRDRKLLTRVLGIAFPAALLIAFAWIAVCSQMRPFNSSPFDAWMGWNYRQIGLPSLATLGYFVKTGIWFSWPAWPFAGWAVYAWRRQNRPLHIELPLCFFVPLALLVLLNPHSEEVLLLPWLPPLAILAAFGLPTMKRGAINAVDWYSVMALTAFALAIWMYWLATQTGWPAGLAKNAFKLAPGFTPEFRPFATFVAVAASVGWIFVVRWRVARRPSVLWRAVVLSSGGVILCWLLLMTLALSWADYRKSYAAVARQIGQQLPAGAKCVDSNVGPAQRASFAYFGRVPFAQFDDTRCDYLLLQDSVSGKRNDRRPHAFGQGEWRLQWEGGRSSDRDERFRLYRRVN